MRRSKKQVGTVATELPLVYAGMGTPWGTADHAEFLAEGIGWVGTPSHGGIRLDAQHNAAVPEYMRRADAWYEEDCNWAIPYIVFEAELKQMAEVRNNTSALNVIANGLHKNTLRAWHPDAYEKFFGVKLQPGESFIRDEQLFLAQHANDWVGISVTSGSSWDPVPAGFVKVTATLGRVRDFGKAKQFLVSAKEYGDRGLHGFVVDPARHSEFGFLPQQTATAPAA